MLRFDPETHTYWIGQVRVPNVSSILAPMTDLSSIPKAVLAYASERGKAVHYGTELYDTDDLDWNSLSDELAPYIEAWADFRATTGFKPQRIESKVFHNGLFYAGTLDRSGEFEGEMTILDIKTTKTMYPTVGMQLAAYAEALHATEPQIPKHTGRVAIQLKEDGTWDMHRYTDKSDWPTFVALRTVVRWADMNKQVIHYEPR